MVFERRKKKKERSKLEIRVIVSSQTTATGPIPSTNYFV